LPERRLGMQRANVIFEEDDMGTEPGFIPE
jgi:hypothetical protein